jgi:glutathione S-transferase
MIQLYQTSISFNSRRVWITLLEKGLRFETVEVQLNGQQFQPEFLALNPFHHIPVLVDGDIRIIESLAILDYLEAKYPQPSLLPTDPVDLAKVRMVEMATVNELAPALSPLFPKMLGLGDGDPVQVAESLQKITTVLQFFEGLLDERPFFGSDTITLAEPVAGTVLANLEFAGITLDGFPKLSAWLDRLMLRPCWLETKATARQMADLRKMMIERLTQSAH